LFKPKVLGASQVVDSNWGYQDSYSRKLIRCKHQLRPLG
jgi:hypothetical protein